MTAEVIDGKELAKRVKQDLKTQVSEDNAPTLAVVLVGDNPASKVYVGAKTKAAHSCGIKVRDVSLSAEVTQKDLERELLSLGTDGSIDSILLQLPLPKHLNEFRALLAIPPEKDADGLHPFNQGMLQWGEPAPRSCTPAGCIELAKSVVGKNLSGKHAVVVGRSILVGKPLAALLTLENCTTVVCHSKTTNLKEECARADLLFLAVGRPKFFDSSYVKPGAIVIDVGINRLDDGSLVGDADFGSVSQTASAVTPVPGGVGPMTIAMLLKNTVEIWKRNAKDSA